MLKKILLCCLLLGLITACSNSDDDSSSNSLFSPELEKKPTEIVNNENNLVPNKVDNEKSSLNSDESNSNANDVTSLIPTGWKIFLEAEGDLNKDGIQDIAIIIESTQESIYASHSLLIAFGNKNNTFSLSIITDNVVSPDTDSLTIDRGSVVVTDYGIGSGRWYHKYKFRFQDNDWYLIGLTTGSHLLINDELGMGTDEDDYNLLTGDFISSKTNENGEVIITKGNKGKKTLVKLSEFDIDDK